MDAENPTPTISVLVPCYQDGLWLEDALRSIASQIFPDFEVIVSDDGSSDDSRSIAQAWCHRDARFRLRVNDRNLGMTPNWNRALADARGELVTKLDADDQMAPDFLDRLVGEHLEHSDVVAVFCRTMDCDTTMRELQPYRGDRALENGGLNPSERWSRRGLDWIELCLGDFQPWTSNAQIHRTRRLKALGGWNENWLASDLDLILRTLELDETVVHRPELAIRYRRREGSHRSSVVQRGWSIAEGILVRLASLERCRDRLRSTSRRLRQDWWRLWVESRRLARQPESWRTAPEAHRNCYEAVLENARRPPVGVLLEGKLRQLSWSFRRRLRSPGTLA